MDELIRQEIEWDTEALEARVMTKIGRQYLVTREEARREEGRSPAYRPAFTPVREKFNVRHGVDYEDRGLEDIEDEIAKLYEIRERKRRGKEPVHAARRPFHQPVFNKDDGSVVNNNLRPESSEMGTERARTKIPTGSEPEGILNYVMEQRRLLTGKNKDQLKVICASEGIQYTTKAPTIERIIEERVKVAYEGFIFTPAPSQVGSPEEEEFTPRVQGARKALEILDSFTSCYGNVLRLVRMDDEQGKWIFAGVMFHKYGTSLRTVAIVKNAVSLWESGQLVYGDFQDFESPHGPMRRMGLI
ncbi:hypothetical protein CBR_g31728 [Chara braunii]|uniref:Uncharacterized protein n=1 Tax=Chara braunii TaxID=69332 RepID=A0A388JY15_CHABU|nr:hypothetical protein CBR_g31728 [Chara braunii]|eukprot:GBG62711.1 hypothetical protein CBR_g31728 [Chara braunii]